MSLVDAPIKAFSVSSPRSMSSSMESSRPRPKLLSLGFGGGTHFLPRICKKKRNIKIREINILQKDPREIKIYLARDKRNPIRDVWSVQGLIVDKIQHFLFVEWTYRGKGKNNFNDGTNIRSITN